MNIRRIWYYLKFRPVDGTKLLIESLKKSSLKSLGILSYSFILIIWGVQTKALFQRPELFLNFSEIAGIIGGISLAAAAFYYGFAKRGGKKEKKILEKLVISSNLEIFSILFFITSYVILVSNPCQPTNTNVFCPPESDAIGSYYGTILYYSAISASLLFLLGIYSLLQVLSSLRIE